MSKSDWCFITAPVGCLLLLEIALQSHNPEKERYQQYSYAADKPIEIKPATPGVPGAQAYEYRRPCEAPKGHDESDLCAQWHAAKAAENSAFWAKLSFWITVVGSGLLLWQIRLTRRALKGTESGTNAAIEANRIAADAFAHSKMTTETDLRPWLGKYVFNYARFGESG